MSNVAFFVQQLEQAHQGGAWHGPSVSEALAGVGAAEACRRPLPGRHTIREIVHHLRVVVDAVAARFSGEEGAEEADWPAAGDMTEGEWQAELARLEASQKALRDAVARFPEGALYEIIPGKDFSYAALLFGVVNHDVYHAGQISLLRQAG